MSNEAPAAKKSLREQVPAFPEVADPSPFGSSIVVWLFLFQTLPFHLRPMAENVNEPPATKSDSRVRDWTLFVRKRVVAFSFYPSVGIGTPVWV